jgi:hypothetical protein
VVLVIGCQQWLMTTLRFTPSLEPGLRNRKTRGLLAAAACLATSFSAVLVAPSAHAQTTNADPIWVGQKLRVPVISPHYSIEYYGSVSLTLTNPEEIAAPNPYQPYPTVENFTADPSIRKRGFYWGNNTFTVEIAVLRANGGVGLNPALYPFSFDVVHVGSRQRIEGEVEVLPFPIWNSGTPTIHFSTGSTNPAVNATSMTGGFFNFTFDNFDAFAPYGSLFEPTFSNFAGFPYGLFVSNVSGSGRDWSLGMAPWDVPVGSYPVSFDATISTGTYLVTTQINATIVVSPRFRFRRW